MHEVAAALSDAFGAKLAATRAVSGGDINDAHRVELADGRVVFVKSNARADKAMFAAEADGLAWLAAPSGDSLAPGSARASHSGDLSRSVKAALRVPRVLAVGECWLALEWLELAGRPDLGAFGRGLAQLHALGAPSFGYARDNFLATLPQANAPLPDWPTFYVERRLRPLCTRARLGVDRQLDALLAHPDRFGPPEPPARLHGDLWWGNVGALAGGAPVVIDPAVYGGHREIDLAMLALFGGLPDALVAAYEDVTPLADGWRDRITLYQLYPLAAHACLFTPCHDPAGGGPPSAAGGSYGAQVRDYLACWI